MTVDMFEWKSSMQLAMHPVSNDRFFNHMPALDQAGKAHENVKWVTTNLSASIQTTTTCHFNRNTWTPLHSHGYSVARHVAAAAQCIRIIRTQHGRWCHGGVEISLGLFPHSNL